MDEAICPQPSLILLRVWVLVKRAFGFGVLWLVGDGVRGFLVLDRQEPETDGGVMTGEEIRAFRLAKVKAILSNPDISWTEKKRRYIHTKHWRTLRNEKMRASGQYCEICSRIGKGRGNDVHHKNYRKLYDVTLDDLMILCQECHNKQGMSNGA